MQEEKMLRIVRECSATIEKNLDEVSRLDSVKRTRIDGAKIESQKKRIADLRKYRDEYSSYIHRVYKHFEKLHDDLRQSDHKYATQTYDKLLANWQNAAVSKILCKC